MKIKEIKTGSIKAPLRVPFKTALRTVDSIDDVLVSIITDTGEEGFGEAPPTAVITGDTEGSIIEAVRHFIGPAIIGMDIDCLEDILTKIQNSMVHNSSAKAAVDMAIYDLYGKLYNIPVYKLLGGARKEITTDITISVNDPETMAKDAEYAVEQGYDTLKIKVGLDPILDVERLVAVRNVVGNGVNIRIDANQGWTAKEAVTVLNRMEEKDLRIQFVEQPVKADNIEGLALVTAHSPVPVMADESVFSPSDALKIMQNHAADMINIKLMKCGGIYNACHIISAAETYGMPVMMGCMLEAKVSVNAAVELTCAKKIVKYIDLDGPALCTYDPVKGGATFEGKKIKVSDNPGMGISGICGN